MNIRTTAIAAIAALGAALVTPALAQHEGHGGGGKGSGQAAQGGGGGMGMGGKGGMHGGGHGMAPGAVMEKCQGHEGMPPHYCAPHYHVMSSVPGAAIARVEPMGEKSLMVTLKAYPGVQTPRVVVVGGGGNLAGGATVAAGWKDGAVLHLDLAGSGSLYELPGMHLHLFPLTGR
jgi:hypothetical protein